MAVSIRPIHVIHVAILLSLLIQTLDTKYDFFCPSRSQWIQRATENCTDSGYYHCLLDTVAKEWREFCLSPVEYTTGRMAVHSGNLNAVLCSSIRYMPFIFVSNMSDECLYQKSKCNEEGQITYENRSTTYDTSCLCDFTKGYAFVTTPTNKCFCIPSEEDCSCYKKICEDQILSSDYTCMQRTQTLYGTQCHVAISQYQVLVVKESNTNSSRSSLKIESQISREIKITVIHVVVVAVILMTIVTGHVCNYCQMHVHEKEIQDAEDNCKETMHQYVEHILPDSSKIIVKDIFIIHAKTAREEDFIDVTKLQMDTDSTKDARVLDMCVFKYNNNQYLVYVDADNEMIVKYSLTSKRIEEKQKLQRSPNRLTKINDTTVAIIYKKEFDILLYDVKNMSEKQTYTVSRKDLEHNPVEGIIALSSQDFILSNRKNLFKFNLERKDTNEFAPSVFNLDTARRLCRCTVTTKRKEEIIFVADENEKKITCIGETGNKIFEQSSHNRGLQNVRAIAATEDYVFAATSAGVSVYFHSHGVFQKVTENDDYLMLIEYEKHVDHTRGLCIELTNDRVWLGLSCVIKRKDMILVCSFKRSDLDVLKKTSNV